jgi:hypothetical protein
MSSFTSVASPGEYNDRRKPPGKAARHDRRTKSSGDDHSADDCVLREAADHQQVGLEDLQAARRQLLKLFARIERFGEQIDEAFAGQPFLPNLPPDAPANRRRFEALLHEQKKITILLGRALELWMLTCHLERDDDWIPRNHRKRKTKARRRRRAPQD